jgi:hypothetical protein
MGQEPEQADDVRLTAEEYSGARQAVTAESVGASTHSTSCLRPGSPSSSNWRTTTGTRGAGRTSFTTCGAALRWPECGRFCRTGCAGSAGGSSRDSTRGSERPRCTVRPRR